ncbi:sigma 54-interacting transcriptional regulator [Algoriphagus sp. D3-2-R+10]|uniref:sigma-54 interaction domain-containing protein n=1 Tax=Algoriphagus aurantiacus TaxID=3103948 RepID=UPI002B36A530|nr:sigma 54-interacting transcriptional regulator [Algoriphagus sp. D3-2-R+10]MEB2778639.1 sigma 54-interacting transcriptional regulator [Algoriphagus sp. D3-2-R+10]
MADNKSVRKLPSGLIVLKKILEGTSEHTGAKFFQSLVKNLAESLDVHGVWVTEYLMEENRLRSLAFWFQDHFVDEYEYDVKGTPCEPVLKHTNIYHIPDKVIKLFPDDPDLKPFGTVSYMGIALCDDDGSVMGHLALLDNKPMEEIPEAFAIFKIFAARAESELKRLKYEQLLVDNEAKLNRLVNGTMDGLVEFDQEMLITQANQSALKTFKTKIDSFIKKPVKDLLDPEGFKKLAQCVLHLEKQTGHLCSTFIQGHIGFIKSNKETFPAETTLSRYRFKDQDYYALFIRNVEDSVKDRQELKKLTLETTLLREKINTQGFDDIIGNSPAILKAMELVTRVAPMDSTVLVRGETGTGKELFAQAIHKASKRKNKPMVTLNCAALPSELVESELFGHVKGAFTGAATSREGRFLLADKGTIFLDEIGELPLSLQAKLLRVLQEGEFEPVGSSKTQKVDVRVIAATNRDLEQEVKIGKFREDLFYRLNVFPIAVPPLHERGEDILLLANAFMEKFAKRSALSINPLNEVHKQRLLAYTWPGNVRELQNIIERGTITHVAGNFNLAPLTSMPADMTSDKSTDNSILTESEMLELEKRNIIKALDATNWKISGDDGAAALLQIPPTTLSSRIGKLGVKKK